MSHPENFDRLAGVYRGLEYLAFGHDLERTRWSLLDRLSGRRSILVLGEGDGRCLAKLVSLAPQARIDCVEASGKMIARAKARLPADAVARVRFHQEDARKFSLRPGAYDAAITLFFLDCFPDSDVQALARNIAGSLQPEALWLFGDFVMPPKGIARWRAKAWLALLYAFFRWQTGIPARRLPASEAAIEAEGFRRREAREFQWGLLRTALFARERS